MFLSNMEVAARWSAALITRGAACGASAKKRDRDRPSRGPVDNQSQEPRVPKGICRQFQEGRCKHPGDRHSSHWDATVVLNHKCAKWLPDQNRFCMEGHSKLNHK